MPHYIINPSPDFVNVELITPQVAGPCTCRILIWGSLTYLHVHRVWPSLEKERRNVFLMDILFNILTYIVVSMSVNTFPIQAFILFLTETGAVNSYWYIIDKGERGIGNVFFWQKQGVLWLLFILICMISSLSRSQFFTFYIAWSMKYRTSKISWSCFKFI